MARDPKFTHLYQRKKWRDLRAAHLATNPVCVECLKIGRTNDGAWHPDGTTEFRRRFLVVDHVIPHRGDMALFYDPENLQTLCRTHHDAHKTQDDRRGYSTAIGIDGVPIDPAHPMNGQIKPTPISRERFSLPVGIQPSGIPVVLVCGPPLSGKSTYIQATAIDGDVVIDYDAIRACVVGKSGRDIRARVYAMRDELILGLAHRTEGTAYLESRAPSHEERKRWGMALLRMRVHEVNPGKEVCLKRIPPDTPAAQRQQVAATIERWYLSAARTAQKRRKFEPREG